MAQLRQTARLESVTATLTDRVIVLDPGHGGPDPGAVAENGTLEKDVVLSIAMEVRRLLEAVGAQVVLTRDGDFDLSGLPDGSSLSRRKRLDLAERVAIGNRPEVALFVSIHANKIPSSRRSGAQTFYYRDGHPDSKGLAESLQHELVRVTGRTRRVASHRIDQYILENLNPPAATVEVGFLSNPGEGAALAQADYQRRVAWAIFLGLARFLATR